MGSHSHSFTEVVVVTSGKGVHSAGEHEWLIASGDAFVINRTIAHAYKNTQGLELINILFDEKRLRIPVRELSGLPGYIALFTLEPAWRNRHEFRSRLRLGVKDLIRSEEIIDSMESELGGRMPGYKVAATALLTQLITHLSRCYSRMEESSSVGLLKIGSAISHIAENYHKPVDLEKLARLAGMPVRSFQRTFKDAMGTSPIDYLLKIRISRAAELLRSGHFSATDAAYEVGFNDSNYFSRQFTRIVGMPPGKYRNRNAA